MLNENFKAVQAENYQLRDYVISLQSRLLESQGEYPPPPTNVDGLHPGAQPGRAAVAPSPGQLAAINQLRSPVDHVTTDPALTDRNGIGSGPSVLSSVGESARMKRARTGSHDMNAAQEALQGPSGVVGHLPSAVREEPMVPR